MANKKETEVITSAQATRESDLAVKDAERERKALARQFKKQDTVPVQVSPLYQPYFGKVMTVTINGVSIAIPCGLPNASSIITFALFLPIPR